MLMRRWATLWLVALMIGAGVVGAIPVAAQYEDELPPGVQSVTVDGQPINASSSPSVENPSPEIAGILDSGPTEVELAIGNGEIVRFNVPVDPVSGAFTGTPPEPLDPGTYSLYIDDQLIGDFTITGEPAPDFFPDLAKMTPLPNDLQGQNFALVDGSLLSVTEEARRTAANSGNDAPEAVAQTEQALTASGWFRRYENRMARPKADDPTQFEALLGAFVIEYTGVSGAEDAFAQVAGQTAGEIQGATVGDESTLVRTEGTTTDTGAPYISLGLTFRVDRILASIVWSDLAGGEPDQAALEALGNTLVGRIRTELEATTPGLSARIARPGLSEGVTFSLHTETYERIDGTLIAQYGENQDQIGVREARYAEANNVYVAQIEGDAGGRFRHVAALYSFADDAAATAWFDAIPERLRSDPLRGYLSMSPTDDAGEFGDGTIGYTFRHRAGGATTSGLRYYIRVGNTVAQIELASEAGAGRDAVDGLAEAQVGCLEAESGCNDTFDIAGLSAGAAPAETPAAGGTIEVTPAAAETPAG